VAGGRGGPTAVFVGISAPVAGLFGVTFAGPVLVPHAPCRLCGRRCRPPRRRVSPRLRCRPRAGRWSAGLSLPLPVTPAVVFVLRRRVVVVCDGLAAHAEEPPPFWWGAAPRRILDAGRVSYEGRPRGVCCRSMPGNALSIPGRA
jgi:hypothetical protein